MNMLPCVFVWRRRTFQYQLGTVVLDPYRELLNKLQEPLKKVQKEGKPVDRYHWNQFQNSHVSVVVEQQKQNVRNEHLWAVLLIRLW